LHGSGTEDPVAGKTPRLSAEDVELMFVGAKTSVKKGIKSDNETPSTLTRTKRTDVNCESGSTSRPLSLR
jgi:hypothetical protein